MATATTVTIDGNQYVVLRDGYRPWYMKGERNTLTASGKDDTIFPSKPQQGWNLVLKLTKSELDSLLTTWAKSSSVSFTDHLGSAHTVLCIGEVSEQTLVPVLDGTSSLYHVPIRLKVKQT